MPNSMRPLEIWSTPATVFASSAGLRYCAAATRQPSRTAFEARVRGSLGRVGLATAGRARGVRKKGGRKERGGDCWIHVWGLLFRRDRDPEGSVTTIRMSRELLCRVVRG